MHFLTVVFSLRFPKSNCSFLQDSAAFRFTLSSLHRHVLPGLECTPVYPGQWGEPSWWPCYPWAGWGLIRLTQLWRTVSSGFGHLEHFWASLLGTLVNSNHTTECIIAEPSDAGWNPNYLREASVCACSSNSKLAWNIEWIQSHYGQFSETLSLKPEWRTEIELSDEVLAEYTRNPRFNGQY